jgi:hypothetical protein
MRKAVLGALALALACATTDTSPRLPRTIASGHVDPAQRDAVFSSALRYVQAHGWLVAVSDRAAGLITTQSMDTGSKPCGSITCGSRSTLQVTVSETGDVAVNLHREFFNPLNSAWFVPTLYRDVRPIEAEQAGILKAIVGP